MTDARATEGMTGISGGEIAIEVIPAMVAAREDMAIETGMTMITVHAVPMIGRVLTGIADMTRDPVALTTETVTAVMMTDLAMTERDVHTVTRKATDRETTGLEEETATITHHPQDASATGIMIQVVSIVIAVMTDVDTVSQDIQNPERTDVRSVTEEGSATRLSRMDMTHSWLRRTVIKQMSTGLRTQKFSLTTRRKTERERAQRWALL